MLEPDLLNEVRFMFAYFFEKIGYDKMAEDILEERKPAEFKRYCQVILNNVEPAKRDRLETLFKKINLL